MQTRTHLHAALEAVIGGVTRRTVPVRGAVSVIEHSWRAIVTDSTPCHCIAHCVPVPIKQGVGSVSVLNSGRMQARSFVTVPHKSCRPSTRRSLCICTLAGQHTVQCAWRKAASCTDEGPNRHGFNTIVPPRRFREEFDILVLCVDRPRAPVLGFKDVQSSPCHLLVQ
jgi:hypothetical protein